jgi:hypothetical protein
LLLTGCTGSEDGKTGTLEGTVIFWQGDFMPTNPTGTKTPVVREVFIYEPTSISEVTPAHAVSDGFYSSIQTKLVATTMSDDSGHFSLILPAGQYSLFVRENGLYYSNDSDANGRIYPVTIISEETTTIEFDITYQATF